MWGSLEIFFVCLFLWVSPFWNSLLPVFLLRVFILSLKTFLSLISVIADMLVDVNFCTLFYFQHAF